MSIVGNRPLPLYEAELLTSDEHIDRFMGPAGLTGLWQVEKRGEAGKLSAEERKQLDIQYAKNFSFGLDIKIILKTVTAFSSKRERITPSLQDGLLYLHSRRFLLFVYRAFAPIPFHIGCCLTFQTFQLSQSQKTISVCHISSGRKPPSFHVSTGSI